MCSRSRIPFLHTLALALALLALASLLWISASRAAEAVSEAARVASPQDLAVVFPEADRIGPFGGEPPAAPAFKDARLVGYVFSTLATVGSTGYSGKPIDILAGLDLQGMITGALLRQHNEPILVIGVSSEDLARYVSSFAGVELNVRVKERAAASRAPGLPDAIAGATVSSAVIRDGILRAGRAVARTRGLLATAQANVRLDRESFSPATWADLVNDGSIGHRRITVGEVVDRLKDTGAGVELAAKEPGATFIDLYVGLLSPPRIGENLLGKTAFNRLAAELGADDQPIIIAADGLYSFKGTDYVRSGRFDRIQIVQGERTIPLTKDGYQNVERLKAKDASEFREIGVFTLLAETGFDPLKPWRLDLLVARETSEGEVAQTVFGIDYTLPEQYRVKTGDAAGATEEASMDAAPGGPPLWQEIWRERWGQIAIVSVILVALTAVLVFQNSLVRRHRLYRVARLGFLTVTLFRIGWYAGAQLSVVNVLTFAHSLMTDFQWEFFLLDPLIFILWSYVTVVLLFWGRGVFCGWLCPFGALQELLSEGARKLRLPQITVPFTLHERLWPIKYIIFIGLLAVSLNSMTLAFLGAEVEPFKTAIAMIFIREWPFVAYALALLAVGLFIERFFCRYLCPLGAALAIPARLRMFEWLKRHPQCGRECAICYQRCPVQSIHPSGAINPNECIYCLNCQELYFDDTTCPPLVAARKRRERRLALSSGRSLTPVEEP